MTRKGQAELALGICLWFSAIGGIIGTMSLIVLAPPLAEMALKFSTFEYFWLAFLGLMCATLVARSSPVKAIASMLLGLLDRLHRHGEPGRRRRASPSASPTCSAASSRSRRWSACSRCRA